jgi:hydroxypyruvate isomerase
MAPGRGTVREGDIIRTIRDNILHIGHFHTTGNPGWHEIDQTQELNYRAIAQAIADLNFQGYLTSPASTGRCAIR